MSVSSDTGSIWLNLVSPDSARLYDTRFVDASHGWSVGCLYNYCSGAIYKYNASVIGIGPGSTGVPSAFKLYQNYPNPFNPATLIRFYVPLESKVILNVYDVLGKRIMQIDKGVIQQGESSFVFEGSGLSSGLYIYELRATNRNSDFSETKRMVLLK
jgi:hypothetical protein